MSTTASALSPAESKIILITGATGKQGGAVLDALLRQTQSPAFTLLAVTRNPSSPQAEALLSKSTSIRLVQGDLDDVDHLWSNASIAASKQKIWGVYSVQISEGPGVTPEREVTQGKALIDKAIEEGVEMFVYSSVERGGDEESWNNETPVPHFRTKWVIETHLRSVTGPGTKGERMMWTVLRPVAFMDNLEPGFKTKVFLTAMKNYLGKDKTMQWVAVEDVGVFAAKALAGSQEWNRRAVGIAGDELTVEEMGEAFRAGAGIPFPSTFWVLGSALTTLVKELGLMIEWFAAHGYKADIHQRRLEHPGIMSLETWLENRSSFAST